VTIAMQTLRYIALLSIISIGGIGAAAAQTPSAAPKANKAAAVKIETHTTAAAASGPRAALAAQKVSAVQASKAAHNTRATRLAMLTPAKATGPRPVVAAIGKSTAVRHGVPASAARLTAAKKAAGIPTRAALQRRNSVGSARVRFASLPAKGVATSAAAVSHRNLMAAPHKARRR
jgi:hypothetical protein